MRASRHKLGRGTAGTYPDRNAWLAGRSELALPTQQRLCVSMQKLAGRHAPSDSSNVFGGWPWLTPVLGSGCLEAGTQPGMNAFELANAVAVRLLDPNAPDVDQPPIEKPQRMEFDAEQEAIDARSRAESDIARRYVLSLAESRLSPSVEGGQTGVATLQVSSPVALLVLASAQTTACYHQLQDLSNNAFGRWDEDEASEDHDPEAPDERVKATMRSQRALDRLIECLQAAIDALTKTGDHDFTTRTIQLLRSLKRNLGEDRAAKCITLRHARLLSELAWYHLTREQRIYPGWSDLLLRMVLEDPGSDEQADSFGRYRQPRPRFKFTSDLEKAVRNLYVEPSEESIDNPDDSQRTAFYDSVAEVLWAQARVGVQEVAVAAADDPDEPHVNREQISDPPHPSAFMTSFDLELPAALWRAAENRSRFSIAMPIYVQVDDQSQEVEAAWVLASYTKRRLGDKSLLSVLQHPDEVLVGHPELVLHPSEPVVTYLNGCPLVHLPTAESASDGSTSTAFTDLCTGLRQDAGIENLGPQTALHHTVIIDEYLAARRSAAELFWLSDQRTNSSPAWSRSLPVKLFNDHEANQRYWMAFGVPIADPAIRTMLTTRMTMRSIQEGAGTSSERPEGVIVGRRIDDEEASVLHWFGFDVVRETECTEFTDDLLHWCRHLEHPQEGMRIAPNGCHLGGDD